MSNDVNLNLRNGALALVVLSLAFCALVIIVEVGLSNTAWDTTDRAGRKMGFNDPLSIEHYGILFSNFRFQSFLTPSYAYAWLLLIMHVVGGGLLIQVKCLGLRRIRWFFGIQGLLFPVGWLGFFVLPSIVRSIGNGTFDREGIIDVPFITFTAQPIWIAISLTILAASWIVPPDRRYGPKFA